MAIKKTIIILFISIFYVGMANAVCSVRGGTCSIYELQLPENAQIKTLESEKEKTGSETLIQEGTISPLIERKPAFELVCKWGICYLQPNLENMNRERGR